MKKSLLILLMLVFITGCDTTKKNEGIDPNDFDAVEMSLSGNKTMQCFYENTEEDLTVRVWMFQDPKTNNLVYSSIMYMFYVNGYDEDGNLINAQENYCKEFDTEKYSACHAVIDEESIFGNLLRVKYIYKLKPFNDQTAEEKKTMLQDSKKELESQGFECNIFEYEEQNYGLK